MTNLKTLIQLAELPADSALVLEAMARAVETTPTHIMRPDDDWAPALFLHCKPKGGGQAFPDVHAIEPEMLADAEGKDILAEAIAEGIRMHARTGYPVGAVGIVLHVWTLKHRGTPEEMKARALRAMADGIAEDPDRAEAVMCSVYHPAGCAQFVRAVDRLEGLPPMLSLEGWRNAGAGAFLAQDRFGKAILPALQATEGGR